MKRILTPLAAACLLAGASLSLHASPYSSLVVFGDSLSDAGWSADSDGPDGATTRFTNRTGPTYLPGEAFGPVAPMILGERLGLDDAGLASANAGGNNWAVGGYRTDQILDSINSADGYLASVGGRADPNALYYLTGGGNDFLQFRVTSPETAQAAAGRLVDSLQTLQQSGARYIMVWLLPDVGKTPAISTTSLADTVSQLGLAYNDELVRLLPTVDAQVIPLNVPLMLSEVLANPGQYGLATDQNLIGTCFDGCSTPNPVYGLNGTNPDPTKLLFNDGVHPTIAGQMLIADYAHSLLAAPWEVSLLPEMAHGTLRSHQDQLRAQWLADWEAWQAVGQVRTFINAGGQRQNYDIHGGDADGNGYSLNLGASYRLDDAWRIGLAAGLYEQGLEVGAGDSDYDLRSYLATAFAQYQHNRWWGELAASVGYLDYHDLDRQFALGTSTRREKADTDGDLWSLSARVGYDIAQSSDSPWHLSPFVSADYARVEVDGYAEDGLSATALNFGDQKRTSKRLGVGLQGLFDLSQQTRLFGELALEREYEDDAGDVDMSLRSLPTIGYTLEGYTPDDKTWRASFGVSHQIAQGLAVRGAYTYRDADDSDQHGVNLSLSWDL
ncbi:MULTISPECIES: autotransporter domain-containing SGNH/GDSL hydrolase family protein [unclassified Pseudomonas]|uniref:autotransporter domain-containing SGNH/GDSL hydrolase family protein n=1 Tax=unclassified Pseudomonas TaxID=196821 RepID=UPI00244D38A0|nr:MULTISPECIES: autotransporter domain-containing SGNH/GDSL hydrolase family protein [unclassified Pseudomonas]MDH0896324.1 autotransporter domain-containing protein [Pseudomonas sp. GD03875]MDH1066084.1 autotransporter domain-containing protein [Pseudomonas sp. GD03985]